MVKVICQETGIEFEAPTKRTKQHPAVAALKAAAHRDGNYGAAMSAIKAVRESGKSTTVKDFIAAVKMLMSSEIDSRHTEKQAAINAAAAAKDARQSQNAELRAYGFKWLKSELGDGTDWLGDSGEFQWELYSPEGRRVTIAEALSEIAAKKAQA